MANRDLSRAEEHYLTEPERDAGKLFDVRCIIGSVYDGGDHTPLEAAFLLIARNGGEGTFSFPSEDGGTVLVGVQHLDKQS